ncbi:MAG: Acetylornithine deacetylase [Phycisphaerae bacterium]|nr:Acetylornithine deacetylase [Phycisphaerae bacterium]
MNDDALVERLVRLASIRSLSRDEGAIVDAVTAELASAGLRLERGGCNVWCEIGDAPRPRLLLNSHLDTVPPGEGWSADPWTPRRGDGRITALGANDAKGCVSAMMQAALRLAEGLKHGERLGGTVVLALTAEEETSGAGLGTILDRIGPIDAALVGEPTGLVPMTAQRGLLILRLTARGRTGHPAHEPPDRAANAIHLAAEDVAALRAFDWGPAHPLLGKCHAHVTQIHGGVARNVIPDSCEFFVDVRTTPLQPHGPAVERLRNALRSDVHVHSDRLVPVETPSGARIVRAVLAALPGSSPTGSPSMSDMVCLSGTPAVKIGPGRPERSHTADEFVTETELRDGAAVYERIVRGYFKAE